MNCILGTCIGYPSAAIRPFVTSLRRNFDGRVVLLTDRLPIETHMLLAVHRIECVDTPLGEGMGAITTQRVAAYRRILGAAGEERVLLTDVRDVLFQADPFSFPAHPLEVFLEDESITIGACNFNSHWIRVRYGEAVLERLRDRPVSCAGTVLGDRDRIIGYLDRMCAELGDRQYTTSVDQGCHNRLLWDGELGDVTVTPNGRGCVQTLGYQKAFRFDRDGLLLNDDNRPCAVVHQFDRVPALFPASRIMH